jgi:4-hydroxy-tetrahydrodipicolinate reductase
VINILQVGLGPLGQKIGQYICDKKSMVTTAAVDIAPHLKGQDFGELIGNSNSGVQISGSLQDVSNIDDIDVAVLTTSSGFEQIAPQVLEILDYNIPIVSTCEELTFPWSKSSELTEAIDQKAKEKNVAVVSTGVNPGFLMDTLPTMLTAVCKDVDFIEVHRIQDAQTRRIPFQKKIGAGLSLEEFEKKKQDGSLRHVGLTESMQFIADAMNWKLDHTEDVISPIIAEENISTPGMSISKGDAMGVRQVGKASSNGIEKIKLIFEAAVGTGISYDEVQIKGNPNITSRIEGGVHGDIATCSIVLNVIPVLLKSAPGLKTMNDLSVVSIAN